jgi:hypothetical protein
MERWRRLVEIEPRPICDPLLDRLVDHFEIDLSFVLETKRHRYAIAVCAQLRIPTIPAAYSDLIPATIPI